MKKFITQHWFKLALLALLAWYVFKPTYILNGDTSTYYKINHLTGKVSLEYM